MTEVIMPKMGDAMEEGTLVEWLKKDGDSVTSGEVIGNIQTDKAVVELTAPASGKLAGLLIDAGDTVSVGVPIAAILKDDESLPSNWSKKSVSTTQLQDLPEPAKKEKKSPEKTEPPKTGEIVEVQANNGDRVMSSPLAKRLAREAGIPLGLIKGTGPKGRIVERDVRAAMQSTVTKVSKPMVELRQKSLTTLQKITASRTLSAKQNIPHYYVTIEVDVDRLSELRELMNIENPDNKLSINDFVIKACALSLLDQPHINASYQDGVRVEHGEINIGVATAVDEGLTLPVIRNCESLTLRDIAKEVRRLVAKARENKLSPEELSGSTFAISNMGMYDVENFAAIINEPNGAIIAVSAARRVPVVVERDGEEDIEIRTRMKVTGSFDHRIIDGAVGAQFLNVLRKYLESPTLLLS